MTDTPIDVTPSDGDKVRPSWRTRVWVWCRRVVFASLFTVVLYGFIVAIGLLPANNDFQPTDGGVQLWLSSGSLHADLIFPIRNEVIDWTDEFPQDLFAGSNATKTFVAIGWGDRNFCINTPTWDDAEALAIVNALFLPTSSSLHVTMLDDNDVPVDAQMVEISQQQYRQIVEAVQQSFQQEQGKKIQIPGVSLGDHDVYFEANGRYHALNTCNSWVGRAMKAGGIRVPWWSPLPKSPLIYLPE